MKLLFRVHAALVVAITTALSTSAQIVIEDSVVTDSVDILAVESHDTVRYPALAMIGSLLVPGLGQQYLRRPTRAMLYYGIELLSVFSAVLCERNSRRLINDSRTLAWMYAGARGGPGADERYWQALASYEDSRGYNHVQELNRTPENKYVEPHLQWEWVDTSYQREYAEIRDNATSFHVASTFFIGGMIVNRLVSFVDARVTTRRMRSPRASRVSVVPFFSPLSFRASLCVIGTF